MWWVGHIKTLLLYWHVSLADNFENVSGWDLGHLVAHGGGRGGTAGDCHVWAIYVCAPVKGMVFKEFTLAYGI